MSLEALKKHNLVYIASPYSNYCLGLDAAAKEVSRVAGQLLEAGVNVFCPIAHGHALNKEVSSLPATHDFWLKYDQVFVDKCDALAVVLMLGWNKSTGVRWEIDQFRQTPDRVYAYSRMGAIRRPIYFVEPMSLEVF